MVRVIGPDSTQLGVMAVSDALRTAREMELDLVEVAPTSRPPVCRIMDFGKYKYEQAKREQKARRKQHLAVVKEIKLRPKIEEHDFDFKMKHARTFLGERDKVKVSILFRGRELSHPELGYALIDDVVQALSDIAQVEQKPAMEGRMLVMMLAPRPGVGAAKPAGPGANPPSGSGQEPPASSPATGGQARSSGGQQAQPQPGGQQPPGGPPARQASGGSS